MFKLGRFSLVKRKFGAIALLVHFIWISVNADTRTLVHTEQADWDPMKRQVLFFFQTNFGAVRLKKYESNMEQRHLNDI